MYKIMTTLLDFSTMSADERANILNQQQNVTIRIPKSLVKDVKFLSALAAFGSHANAH